MINYTVQVKDTLFSIAMRFGLTLKSLLLANPDIEFVDLKAGSVIVIPVSSYRYITYDILGSSDKISQAQMNEIIKWRKEIVEFAKVNLGEVYINGLPNERRVSLTFDDGPDSSVTPKVLDILKKNNIKGTFSLLESR